MTITAIPVGLSLDAAFGEVIHLRLRRRGIHQRDVAEALGMTQGAVSHKLRGARPWHLADMAQVAEFLGEDLGHLVSEAECARRDSNPKPSVLSSLAECNECQSDNTHLVIDLQAFRAGRAS